MLACTLACGRADNSPAQPPPGPQTRSGNLHPAFSLDREDLAALTAELPPPMREAILENPRDFLDLMSRLMREPEGLLVLVDKSHPLPEGWEPQDLKKLSDYPLLRLSRQNLLLRAIVLPDLLDMAREAQKDGITLLVSSTYRSAAYQKTVYERNVREMGQQTADRESAWPRHSQHQLGTVIDFGSINDDFTGTPMQRWLDANAWKYGFSLSFPEGREELTGYRYESWHFRYIGRSAAEMARRFFGDIQQIMLEYLHLHIQKFAAAEI
jgi:D-alanyl-D-alanine carboxypeptidase